jgi:beta-lactamase regulating signal transducer with metallopeptidase domain
MWGLVALRLIVPPILPADFGMLPAGLAESRPESVATTPAEIHGVPGKTVSEIQQQPAPESAVPVPADSPTFPASAGAMIFSIWLGGALITLAALTRNSLRQHARCRCATALTRPETLALLESCKRAMGVRSDIAPFECPGLAGPALCGVFRPRIMLSPGMDAKITAEELRHVFLHELAHLRRRDVPVNCLCALLLAAHWFNPLVRIAFARMRREQEIACDEAALAALGTAGRNDYGHTLIKLSGYISTPTPTFGMVGLGADKKQLTERILMIKRWKTGSKSLPGVLALLLVASAALLTEACTQITINTAPGDKAAVTSSTGGTDDPDDDDAKTSDNTKNPDPDRFIRKLPVPDRKCTLVVSEGDFESRSIGSYTVRLYSNEFTPEDAPAEWQCDSFSGSLTRERDGSIKEISFTDIDDDGKKDLVVEIECAGTGSYRTFDAYSFANNRLRLIASIGGFDPQTVTPDIDGSKTTAKGIELLIAKAKAKSVKKTK